MSLAKESNYVAIARVIEAKKEFLGRGSKELSEVGVKKRIQASQGRVGLCLTREARACVNALTLSNMLGSGLKVPKHSRHSTSLLLLLLTTPTTTTKYRCVNKC